MGVGAGCASVVAPRVGWVNDDTESPEISPEIDALVGDWLALPEVAERLDVRVTRVHNLIRDGAVIAVRRGHPPVRSVPELFLDGGRVLPALRGTLTLLSDAGYSDEEALGWLFRPDESLPGRPVDALRDGRKTEARRRAQALAW